MALTTPSSSAEVKESLDVYLYSPSVPSWPVIGWPIKGTPLFLSQRSSNKIWLKRICKYMGRPHFKECKRRRKYPPSGLSEATPWFRRLVASLSPRRAGLDSWPIHVRFEVHEVAIKRLYLKYFGFALTVPFCQCSTPILYTPVADYISSLTFRHRASCILGQAFHYSPENAFYVFNQHIYFINWYLLDRASLI